MNLENIFVSLFSWANKKKERKIRRSDEQGDAEQREEKENIKSSNEFHLNEAIKHDVFSKENLKLNGGKMLLILELLLQRLRSHYRR